MRWTRATPRRLALGVVAALTCGTSDIAMSAGPGPLGGAGQPLGAKLEANLRSQLGPDIRVTWDDAWQSPRRVSGLAVATHGANPSGRALAFLEATRTTFAAGANQWRVTKVQPMPGGGSVVRCAVLVGELPVDGHEVVVQLDHAQRVVSVTRDPAPAALPVMPVNFDANGASALVKARFEVVAAGRATKVVLSGAPGTERIAWRVPVTRLPNIGHHLVWIDAETGATLRVGPGGFDETEMPLTLRGAAHKMEAPR